MAKLTRGGSWISTTAKKLIHFHSAQQQLSQQARQCNKKQLNTNDVIHKTFASHNNATKKELKIDTTFASHTTTVSQQSLRIVSTTVSIQLEAGHGLSHVTNTM